MIEKQIWLAYLMKCEMSYRTRNGTIACRALKALDINDIYQRSEFVAEHEARAAYLLGLFMLSYPGLVPDTEWFQQLMFMLIHDHGEFELGDQLDDGTMPHDEVRKTEEETMQKLAKLYPDDFQNRIMKMYREFETYSGEQMLAKAIDKAEAVLFQVFLYKHGLSGDVRKKEYPSERDLRFGRLLGTYCSADIWCLHARVAIKHMPAEIITPVESLLNVAFMDTYNRIPECMMLDTAEIEL